MLSAVHPGGHHVARRHESGREVLARQLPVITGRSLAVGEVPVVVLAAGGQVVGPALGGLVELRHHVQGRKPEADPLLIDQAVHGRGHFGYRGRCGRRVCVGAGAGPVVGRPGVVRPVMTTMVMVPAMVPAMMVAMVGARGGTRGRHGQKAQGGHADQDQAGNETESPGDDPPDRAVELYSGLSGELHTAVFGAGRQSAHRIADASAIRPDGFVQLWLRGPSEYRTEVVPGAVRAATAALALLSAQLFVQSRGGAAALDVPHHPFPAGAIRRHS